MKMHEYWQSQYLKKRYLEHISDVELDHRLGDLFNNCFEISGAGKYQFFPNPYAFNILQRFTEALQEKNLRGAEDPLAYLHEKYPLPAVTQSYMAQRIAALCKGITTSKPILVKYLEEESFAYDMRDKGRVKISAASSYKSDPRLNPAQIAEELKLTVETPLIANNSNRPTPKRIQTEVTAPSDFYIYCTCDRIKPRMFLDFNAKACVVITEPEKFIDKLNRAVHRKKGIGKRGRLHGRIEYFDPFFPPAEDRLMPGIIKPLRYAYQSEIRQLWYPHPANMTPKLESFFVEVGSLSSICSVYTLEQ